MNEKLEENSKFSALCRIYKSNSEGSEQASLQARAIKGTTFKLRGDVCEEQPS